MIEDYLKIIFFKKVVLYLIGSIIFGHTNLIYKLSGQNHQIKIHRKPKWNPHCF